MADDIVGKVRSIFDDVVGAKQSELQAINSQIQASAARLTELETMEKEARDRVARLNEQANGASKIVTDAESEAKRIRSEAEALSRRIVGAASQSADDITRKADTALRQLKQALKAD